MDRMAHILIVDDDPGVRDVVSTYLSEEGFHVSAASGGPEMYAVLHQKPVDLVILDVKLPGESGFSLAAELRRRGTTGIVMLSGKGELVDRVAGLEIGADDYVAKPFHLRELLARVRSVLRRRQGEAASAPAPANHLSSEVRFAGFVLDRVTRQLVGPDGRNIDISAGEFELLLAFLARPRRPLTRDQLLDLAHGRTATQLDRSIDVQVGRLRRKIEANPRRPELITTIRGVGYMFAADVEAA
jgi:DNA-binding response OmpR family regulator